MIAGFLKIVGREQVTKFSYNGIYRAAYVKIAVAPRVPADPNSDRIRITNITNIMRLDFRRLARIHYDL